MIFSERGSLGGELGIVALSEGHELGVVGFGEGHELGVVGFGEGHELGVVAGGHPKMENALEGDYEDKSEGLERAQAMIHRGFFGVLAALVVEESECMDD